MTKLTTAEIRERQEYVDANYVLATEGEENLFEIAYVAHNDRGILLDRLEDAETKLQKNLQTVIHHHKCCCDICRGRKQTILEQNSE